MALFVTNTNLIEFAKKQHFDLPKNARIRWFLNQYLKTLENENIVLKLVVAGNRVLNNCGKEIKKIANGRNIRIYYAIKKNKKIKIKYVKYKIKHLNIQEESFIEQNWNVDFFETLGKKFVEQINGANLENFLYNYM